jgi:hypothetical protein
MRIPSDQEVIDACVWCFCFICNNGDGKTAASGSDRLPEHRVS